MRKALISLLFTLTIICAHNLNAQITIANWDNINPDTCFTNNGIVTESVNNPNIDAINASAKVLKFERESATNKEALIIEFSEARLIQNSQLVLHAIMPIEGKVNVVLQNDQLQDVAQVSLVLAASTAWQEIKFDFAGAILANTYYKRLLVYPAYENKNSQTYYFDNIKFQSGIQASSDVVIALEKFMGSPNDENSFEGYTNNVLNWWSKNGEFTNDSIVINRYPTCSWLSSDYNYPEPSKNAVVELGADAEINKTDTLIFSNISTNGFTDYQVILSSGGYNSVTTPNVFVKRNNESWNQLTFTGVDSVANQIIQYKIPTGIISAEKVSIMLACNSAAAGHWIDDVGLLGKPVLLSSIVIGTENSGATLAMGSVLQMHYNAAPNNALDTTATWSVEPGTGSATISKTGLLEPVTAGTVTVKATANDGSGVIAQKEITIVEAQSVEITINGGLAEINTNNGTLQLNAAVLPTEANQTVQWSLLDSNDADTAAVSNDGLVTAIRNGIVEVIATTIDGTHLTDTVLITLSNQIVEPDTFIIADAAIYNDDVQVQMTIASSEPHDADKSVIWSIDASDTDTATITTDGLLSPLRNGTVKVIAVSNVEGVKLSTFKNVQISGQVVGADSIKIQAPSEILVNDGSITLSAIVYPNDAANKDLVWSIESQDEDTAYLQKNVLTAVRNGVVTIRATSVMNNAVFDEYEVTILNQVVELERFEISGDHITTNAGTSQLEIIPYPLDAQNIDLIWWLSNAADSLKATLSPTGLLTGYRNGSITVYAKDKTTGFQASKVIDINGQIEVEQIILSNDVNSLITVNKGTMQVYAEVLPADARIREVDWSIVKLDGNAIISSNGLVTAKGNGEVYVIAKAIDGTGITDTMLIKISGQVAVSEVSIINDTSYITKNNGSLTLDVLVGPANAADMSLTWSLLNGIGNLATIDANTGLVTALRNGMVQVKAASNSNPEVSDTALVIIENQIIEPDELIISGKDGADSITVNDGELQLLVSANPNDAVTDVIWGIADEHLDLAAVDTNGLVTAFRNGTVFVQATSTLVPTVGASYEIVITNQVVEPLTLEILSERGATTIERNDGILKLIAQVTPKDAVDDVTWSIVSNDADTATIDETGIVKALRNGRVTVQAVSTEVDTLVATFDIEISNQIIEPEWMQITSVTGSNKIEVNNGTLALQIETSPEDAVKDVDWSIYAADADTAIIDELGVVTALRNGSATVVAKSVLDSKVMNVYEVAITNQIIEAESLYIYGKNDQYEITENKGSLQMMAIVTPGDTDDKLIWTIADDDKALATIDTMGLVKAISDGVATVVAYMQNADTIRAEAEITLSNQYTLVSEIIITAEGNATGIDVKGGTLQLNAEIIPDTAMYKDLEWKSSNEEVATVTSTGLVTAVSNGTVLIIASATDGSYVYSSVTLNITNQTVAVNNVSAAALNIFPNPVSNRLYVSGITKVSKAEIINANGAVIDVSNEFNVHNSINVSDLTSGVYVLKIITDNTDENLIFIKQ